jgi:hypothetical protein
MQLDRSSTATRGGSSKSTNTISQSDVIKTGLPVRWSAGVANGTPSASVDLSVNNSNTSRAARFPWRRWESTVAPSSTVRSAIVTPAALQL